MPPCSWVERRLAPAINAQGAQGWDMMRAIEALAAQARAEGDAVGLAAGEARLGGGGLQVKGKGHAHCRRALDPPHPPPQNHRAGLLG